ncbi:hypothetical protein BCON_0249g00090 [Botryotinia convoluta]|uniref:Uncharacterized protein n=1 Tax=Botryotinia convoluta TaxID=54673 RepID=A0A4Z1HI10_9HELO|nr:hypothetical protein BCON_0249g00090 [Botryotinia convoluta]
MLLGLMSGFKEGTVFAPSSYVMRNKRVPTHKTNFHKTSRHLAFSSNAYSSSIENQTRKKPRMKEVLITMAHHGPLAPWHVRDELQRKITQTSQNHIQQPRQKTVSIFSSQYILGYNVMNDEIPTTGPIVREIECPAGLNYKERKHWHHQKKFYTKIAEQQVEWPGISDDEEKSAEAPENSEDENVDEVTGHHRLTNDLGSPSSPVAEPVVPLLERGLSHSRKLRTRSLLPTAIGRNITRYTKAYSSETTRSETTGTIELNLSPCCASKSIAEQYQTFQYRELFFKNASTQTILSYSPAASIVLEEAAQKSPEGGREGLLSMSHNGLQHSNSRLVSRNLSKEDRGIHTSPNVAHLKPMLATAFPSSTIGSCAMRAASSSRIAPEKPTAFFPALGQHFPADVFAVTSPTRALLIDSSISVAVSSTIISEAALDGHLGSKFPVEVQLVNPMPVGRPAVASNTSMQVAPRLLAGDTIIDVENPSMFNITGYVHCPRTKLFELQEMWLRHLDLTYLAIASGDLELSNDPDLELGGLNLLVEDDIHLD